MILRDTIANDTTVYVALAKGVGGNPAFQGDPGLLLEITRYIYSIALHVARPYIAL